MSTKKFYKPNVIELLNQKAKPIEGSKNHNPDEGMVTEEIKQMQTEIKEIALLKDQLNNRPNDVNSFLQSKYTDGSAFAVAQKDKYDNSDERKRVGISFTYHVFYPINPEEKLEFANNKYVITSKLLDVVTGDEYFYHFPIRKVTYKQLPYYKIDYFDELITPDGKSAAPADYTGNEDRLFNALQTLSANLNVGNSHLPRDVYNTLIRNSFMSDKGKLTLDVRTGVMVEKYFLKFDSLDRKKYGIQYLEKEFKKNPTATVDIPENIITPEAVGSETDKKEVAETTTTTTTNAPVKVEVEDDSTENVQELTEIVVQKPGEVTVSSYSSGSGKISWVKARPIPKTGDSIPDVVKLLRARNVTVTILKGTTVSKAEFSKNECPVPLCYGKSCVLLVYLRPLVWGMNGKMYEKGSKALYDSWLASITTGQMKSTNPAGKIREMVMRDFDMKMNASPVQILTSPETATEEALLKTKFYEKINLSV